MLNLDTLPYDPSGIIINYCSESDIIFSLHNVSRSMRERVQKAVLHMDFFIRLHNCLKKIPPQIDTSENLGKFDHFDRKMVFVEIIPLAGTIPALVRFVSGIVLAPSFLIAQGVHHIQSKRAQDDSTRDIAVKKKKKCQSNAARACSNIGIGLIHVIPLFSSMTFQLSQNSLEPYWLKKDVIRVEDGLAVYRRWAIDLLKIMDSHQLKNTGRTDIIYFVNRIDNPPLYFLQSEERSTIEEAEIINKISRLLAKELSSFDLISKIKKASDQ